jgi:hypothetical protein
VNSPDGLGTTEAGDRWEWVIEYGTERGWFEWLELDRI